MRHVMIDLETLGVVPGCVVLQIGAVCFDPNGGELGEKFGSRYARVSRVGAHELNAPSASSAAFNARSSSPRPRKHWIRRLCEGAQSGFNRRDAPQSASADS